MEFINPWLLYSSLMFRPQSSCYSFVLPIWLFLHLLTYNINLSIDWKFQFHQRLSRRFEFLQVDRDVSKTVSAFPFSQHVWSSFLSTRDDSTGIYWPIPSKFQTLHFNIERKKIWAKRRRASCHVHLFNLQTRYKSDGDGLKMLQNDVQWPSYIAHELHFFYRKGQKLRA